MRPYTVFVFIVVSAGILSSSAWADRLLAPHETTFLPRNHQGSDPKVQGGKVLALQTSEGNVDAIAQASKMTPGKKIGCMCWGLFMGALGGGLFGGTIGGVSSGGRSFREVIDRAGPGLLIGAASGGIFGFAYSVYWMREFDRKYKSSQESFTPVEPQGTAIVYNFSWTF